MKNLIIIVVFLLSNVLLAQQDEPFKEATTFYNQEKYQEAIDIYTLILEDGYESAELYYNLGNAHYKLSHIAYSIYFYEKGLKLAPNDEDILNNLNFAKNETIDEIEVMPEGFVSRNFNRFTNTLSFDSWAWISVVCVFLFVIFFIVYYVAATSMKKRVLFLSSILSFMIAIFALFFAFKQYSFVQNNQYAIIFAEQTFVKNEPNLRSDEVFELHEGTKVKITETINDWKKIRLADGKIGWIPVTDLKEL